MRPDLVFVFCGTLLGLLTHLKKPSINPGAIPVRWIVISAPVISLATTLAWFTLSSLVFHLAMDMFPEMRTWFRWSLAFSLGLLLPANASVLRETIYPRFLDYRGLTARLLSTFDYLMARAWTQEINRFERRVTLGILLRAQDNQRLSDAIDTIYEDLLPQLIHFNAARARGQGVAIETVLPRVRNQPNKIRFLMRYLGVRGLENALHTLAEGKPPVPMEARSSPRELADSSSGPDLAALALEDDWASDPPKETIQASERWATDFLASSGTLESLKSALLSSSLGPSDRLEEPDVEVP